ncbi:MAG: hypothetical protein HQ471_10830 [Flavobacteriales bacterium]|jgi:hypothetical protein|nr:hypothetical protein [Flavobacteriales bacterium]
MKLYYAAKNYQPIDVWYSFYKTLGRLFLFIGIGLYVDSIYFSEIYPNGQWIANFAMFLMFWRAFSHGTKRSRELMIYAVLIGVGGEYLFSIGFEMYTYRLDRVPIYVPLGHAIIYIVTVYFTRRAAVKKFRVTIEKILIGCIIIYATLFLVFANDVFGFVMSLLVVWILRNKPRERLLYLSMYAVVAVLEIVGTSYQSWYWPDTAFGLVPFLKSANPPSGICLFYFGLDLGCLWLYKQRHKIAWKRMKSIRLLHTKS